MPKPPSEDAVKPSDAPYKVLFQDIGLFKETVRLIAPKLADSLNFETVTSMDKEHLNKLARTRVQDKLRRVEFKAGRLRNGPPRYLLALLEFQSRHDRDMAWRMRDYLHLVESALRETRTVRTEGGVPDMLSIVIHNGGRAWRAAAECVGPVIGDEPPERLKMYATVDLWMLARGPDAEGRELAPGSRLATLAELESAPPDQMLELLLAAFRHHAGAESTSLRRGLHLRVEAALTRFGRAGELPPLAECERVLAARRRNRMTGMMEANIARWEKANVARGQAQGRIALLCRQAEWRFDADVAGQLAALLADVTDVSRLDKAGEWLLACDSGEALLERLRAEGYGASS